MCILSWFPDQIDRVCEIFDCSDDLRTANIICDSKDGVTCLVIDRETFKQLISNLDEIRNKYNDEGTLERKRWEINHFNSFCKHTNERKKNVLQFQKSLQSNYILQITSIFYAFILRSTRQVVNNQLNKLIFAINLWSFDYKLL